jgi:hypothetical protein
MRFQKLMWHNMMKSTKSQKVSILYYSINYHLGIRPRGNPFPKKPPTMRVWVRSLETSKYTCVRV